MRQIIDIAIVLIAACASAVSVAWPFDVFFYLGSSLWWLQCISLATLGWVLTRCAYKRQAVWIGVLFATAWMSATFWWLFVAMHTYGGMNAAVSVLAVFVLAVAVGGFYVVACGVFWHLSRSSTWMASASFAALWTMAELARGTWLTGFGWGAMAYAHVDGPLAFYAPWLGVYGVGAIAAWLSMSIAVIFRSSWVHRAAVILVLAVPLFAPRDANEWTQPAGSLSVSLLQGNIPQNEKFEAGSGVPLALAWYEAQLRATRADLVVAPETAIPLLPEQLPSGYWQVLKTRFASGGQSALFGIPLGSYAEGYTNSVIGLTAQQTQPWRYDKHHLVPFGEFIPPLFRWFTELMHIPLGDFNRGGLGQASFESHGQRLALNICYEDLFGEELGVQFRNPNTAPTIFVNVSNIGWFGNTVVVDQHLQISRMRALEFQRPFARATNTGATVILDHQARVTASLPRYTRGTLEGDVQGRTGTTPYAWWVSRFGLWPLWIISLGIWTWAARRTRSQR